MPRPEPANPARKPRYGDEVEVRLTGYDRRGRALGRAGEDGAYDARLGRGAPGDLWRAMVVKRRRGELDLRPLALLEPGAARVAPRCAHHASCGGCSFQECAYDAQLAHKHAQVTAALRAAGVAAEVEPVEPCAEPWGYRNKMEFSFGNRRWVEPDEPAGAEADFALGLHAPGRFDKVLHLAECRLVFPAGEALLRTVGRLARELALEPWDVRTHSGLLRHLVVRHGANTGEVLVNLVTSREEPQRLAPLVAALLAAHPEITTLVQTIHTGVASVAYGERELVLHGPGWLVERMLGLEFRVSARSFFQVNTHQAERLFAHVRAEAAPAGDELVHDLYSGAGTIALLLAGAAREVHAFEEVPEAVADARGNAERNAVTNVVFHQGDVLAQLDRVVGPAAELARPDVVVVDPPRAGLHPKVPAKLLELGARRLVYVSCNVHNGAGDVARLVAGGYRVTRVRPFDLFPHTPHVECVLTLERAAT